MAIARITVFHARLPLRWSVGHATARRKASENIFASVELEDGTVGFGEGVPRPYVTGETLESCWQALENLAAEQLVEAWPSPGAMDEALDFLLAGTRKAPSARSALELALLDALGKASGKPAACIAAEALGTKPPIEGEIAYSAVLPLVRPALLRALCWGARAYGFPSVKLKVTRPAEEGTRRLEAARRWLGPAVELRADANGAWSPEETLGALEACRRAGVTCLEQPVERASWSELAGMLPSPQPVALMADESVCTEEDLLRLVSSDSVQAVNCRVAKMGGLMPAARIGRAASEAGVDILVGCHVGESTLLSAAGRHLAALLPEARWFEGSYDRWLLGVSLADEPLGFGRGGRAPLKLSAGLGVDFRREALERIALRQIVIWPPGRPGR